MIGRTNCLVGSGGADVGVTYLYNMGDECEDLTGGIGAYKVRESGYKYVEGSVVKNEDSISITLLKSNGSNSAGAITNKPIDLTN